MSDNSTAPVSTGSTPSTTESNTSQETSTSQQHTEDTKKAEAAERRRLKLKVNGKEEELDEDEVIRRAQISTAAQKKFEEASKLRKQAEAFINDLRTNPRKILTNPELGINFRQLAEEFLVEELKSEMLTPEQRKMKENEERLKQYEDKEKEVKRLEEEKQRQQLEAHYAEEYQRNIIEALDIEALPRTEYTVKRMAELMYKNLKFGYDLKPAQIARLVREDYIKEQKALFSATDADTLIKLMDEDVIKKIRQADLKRLRESQPQLPKDVSRVVRPSNESTPRKSVSVDDWKSSWGGKK